MKQKLVARIQSLGRQAEQLRQVVEAAPAQAARLRDSIALTVGQLQQVRSEIQTGMMDLRADTGDHLLKAFGEIRETTGILRQAGFDLAGVDLELGHNAGQRLLLVLRRVEEVPAAMIRALATANPDRLTLRAVLGSLQRAVELAATVQIPDLDFRQVTVSVGPVPSVRIGWRPGAEQGGAVSQTLSTFTSTQAPPAPPSEPGVPPVLESSLLVSPARVPVSAPPSTPPPPVVPPASEVAPSSPAALPTVDPRAPLPTPTLSRSAKTLGPNWRDGALDRFRKRPDPARTA